MRFLRRKKVEGTDARPIMLTSIDGEIWLTFPGQVVDAVSQAIARLMRTDPFPEILVMISAVRQEGVTYLSKAMGTILAQDFGQSCCVVELNWWWPAGYPESISRRPGVAEVLEGKVTLEEALIKTGIENLSLLPAGQLPHKLRSTFTSGERLPRILSILENKYDHLILDIPAATATSDSILLASLGTDVCFVIHQGVTPVQRVKVALDDLDHLNIVGVIMNQVKTATPTFLLDYIVQE